MKKTTNISISGFAFNVEHDACQLLSQYIEKIEKVYCNSPECKEIVDDIEARIAELILSDIKDVKSVVTLRTVNSIIDQMGLPEVYEQDIASQDFDALPRNIPHRLYRNMEGGKLGGVLNGIASYFSIDVSIIRVAYVVLFVSIFYFFDEHNIRNLVFVMVTVYLCMWIFIPRAKTPRQKLEMQGKPITVSSLESSFKGVIDAKGASDNSRRSANALANSVYTVGRIIRFCIIVIASVFAVSMALYIIGIVIAAIYMCFSGINFVSMITTLAPITAICAAAVALLAPAILMLYVIIKMIFTLNFNRAAVVSLIAIWILSWGFVSVNAFDAVMDNSTTERVDNTTVIAADTLYLKPINSYVSKLTTYDNFFDNQWREDIDINLNESVDSLFKVKITRSSNGRGGVDASANCEMINVDYKVEGNVLYIDPIFLITQQMKYHDQDVQIDIYVPKGKQLIIDNGFRKSLYDDLVDDLNDLHQEENILSDNISDNVLGEIMKVINIDSNIEDAIRDVISDNESVSVDILNADKNQIKIEIKGKESILVNIDEKGFLLTKDGSDFRISINKN